MFKKERYRIEPFRHRVDLEPDYKEKTWKRLESAMRDIFDHNPSKLSFEELYRCAYNMVLHKFGSYLYENVVRTISARLEVVGREVESESGQAFLQQLVHSWSDYTRAMQNIRDILMYMNKTFVKQHNKTPVHELGNKLWNENLLQRPLVRSILRQVISEAILKFRESCQASAESGGGGAGNHQENKLISAVAKMAMDIGPKVYEEVVEAPIQQDTQAFYRAFSQQAISEKSCPEYLRSLRRCLEDESRMVDMYLFEGSKSKVISKVEEEMIQNQVDVMINMEGSGLLHQLKGRHYGELELMYSMLKRSPNGLPAAIAVLRDNITETGTKIIQQRVSTSSDSMQVVNQLIEERALYDTVIRESLHGDKAFSNAIQLCFEKVLNSNPATPEYLSVYLDANLRKDLKGKADEEAEAIIDRVMTLFRYLHEKDVFEKYYKQHLAKRLLSGKLSMEDHERTVILKLKTECGYQFTSKLESMFNDIRTSQDIMQDYKNHHLAATDGGGEEGRPSPIDLSVQVLTTGSWPIDRPSQFRVPIPKELQECCTSFEDFYLKTHSGRKLAWQTNMGYGELRAGGFEDGKKHELCVTTVQICVLMLFDGEDGGGPIGYGDIRRRLGPDLPEAELKRTLQSLACVKGKNVLVKTPLGRDIGDADVFEWNVGFRSKLYRIKIQQIRGVDEREERGGVGVTGGVGGGLGGARKMVEEDRKPQIEAAIVRVMKSRRVMQVSVLVGEVIGLVKGTFRPEVGMVKQRIESLIDREFLERDEGDFRRVRYIS
ncbi:cullin [Chloropicon primus]|uniref:Cullin n=3 Tax=Chloropicon primus TaxID=1764295 RepID=A0A5B8MZ19_9CHLO|nr:cullin [Chloropicon primus]UPR05073.1 cullin [Chloropicon primus]|eukprot:QDZ25877.1 cullin [Chloropicon primus]